jgi:hypothetical protein
MAPLPGIQAGMLEQPARTTAAIARTSFTVSLLMNAS